MSDSGPFVSFVVPAYNARDHISGTLNSIASQIDQDFEVIVVDDGSTDGTTAEVERLRDSAALRDKLVSLRQANMGVSVARNVGLTKAQGEMVVFLDADDAVSPCLVQTIRRTLHPDSDAIAWRFKKVLDSEISFFECARSLTIGSRWSGIDLLEEVVLGERWSVWTGSIAYRRSHLTRQGIAFTPNCSSGEDREFIYKALGSARVVQTTPTLLSHYVQRDESLSKGVSLRHFDSIAAHQRAADYLSALQPTSKVPAALLWSRSHPSYFRYVVRLANASKNWHDFDAALEEVGHAIPGVHRAMRHQAWVRMWHRRRLIPSVALLSLSPRVFYLLTLLRRGSSSPLEDP